MGLFDSVYADCPRCGRRTEFQSKADDCPYMNSYTVEDAPQHILEDVLNDPQWCAGCKTWFALIDPAHLPGGVRPRPQPIARAVRDPLKGEYSVYEPRPDELRWWTAPFTFDDLADAMMTERAGRQG